MSGKNYSWAYKQKMVKRLTGATSVSERATVTHGPRGTRSGFVTVESRREDRHTIGVRPEPAALTDSALAIRAAPGPVGRAILAARPLAFALGAIPIAIRGIGLPSLALGAATGGIAVWILGQLVRAPRARYTDELAYRRWIAGETVQLDERAQARYAAQCGAPDWLILIAGRFLPHGGAFFIAAELRGELGAFDLRISGRFPRTDLATRVARAISPEEHAAIAAALAGFPDGFASTPLFDVKDGAPCHVAIHHCGQRAVFTCNLAGPSASRPKVLATLLYAIGEPALPTPPIVGATDPYGAITLGTPTRREPP